LFDRTRDVRVRNATPEPMTMTAFTAVLLYAVWTLLLPIVYAGAIRVPMIAAGRKTADHWERGKANDDPPVLVRAKNAHLNCTENFPIFAAVVLVAALMGRTPVVDSLAAYVLYARLIQSLVHISGTSMPLIAIRGAFYFIQVVLILYMVAKLLYHA
jgi:uncharacterized MAPEG superfamily protein